MTGLLANDRLLNQSAQFSNRRCCFGLQTYIIDKEGILKQNCRSSSTPALNDPASSDEINTTVRLRTMYRSHMTKLAH